MCCNLGRATTHFNHEINSFKAELKVLFVAHNPDDYLRKENRERFGTFEQPSLNKLETLSAFLFYGVVAEFSLQNKSDEGVKLVLFKYHVQLRVELEQNLKCPDCGFANRPVSLPDEHDFFKNADEIIIPGFERSQQFVLQQILLHLRVNALIFLRKFAEFGQRLYATWKIRRHESIGLFWTLEKLFELLNELFNLVPLSGMLFINSFLHGALSFVALRFCLNLFAHGRPNFH